MNYSSYKMTGLDWIKLISISVGLTGLISFLFYNCLWGMLLSPLALYLAIKIYKNQQIEKQKSLLTDQFVDCLRSVCNGLMSGYSMENAWSEAERELVALHGKKAFMSRELEEMNRGLRMSIPLEKSLEDFAERSDCEDIMAFSEIFSFAKRSGGSFVEIIEKTTDRIQSKADIRKDIQVLISSKKLEQKVMNVVPLFMLLYLRVTSPGYLDCLYGNAMGIGFMTICLLAYGVTLLIAGKIMDIRV